MRDSEKLNKFQIIILGVLSAFAVFSMDFYLPGLPALQKDLGTTASLAQMTITTSLVGLGVGQLFIGPWSDRIGRRLPLLLGTLIFGITSLLMIDIQNIWLMIVLRFFQGLSGSVGIVLSLAIITDRFDGKELTKNIAINQAINGIFPVLAPVLGGVVVMISNWRMTFVIMAIMGGCLWLAVKWGLPETRNVPAISVSKNKMNYRRLFQDKRFMAYLFVQALMMASLFAYIAGSSFVLENIFHLSIAMFGLIYAINGIGITIATSIAGILARKYGEHNILGGFIIYGILGGLLLSVSLRFTGVLELILVAFFIITSSIGGVQGMATALAMRGKQEHAGSASALLGMARYAIGGLMSPLVGVFGTQSYVALAVLICLVQWGAFGLYLLVPTEKM
ncbi:multidrug effflux MFS transporter [Weissella coleopterorum]|uniref:Bcr/CflA family efflux transporter n=1 Tax=Weissella coleopterorum TaxID=2714949 RepID=A0A6G8AZM1_9LACO|nr:multidrug effflux MFS transporter [Weissella coleopterorum]QIL50430.1 multidrug effflux MFS transporter [Weissella coleopterorum]